MRELNWKKSPPVAHVLVVDGDYRIGGRRQPGSKRKGSRRQAVVAAMMVSATAVSISWSTRFFIVFLCFFLVVAAYTAPVFVSSFE